MSTANFEKDIVVGMLHDKEFLARVCESDLKPEHFSKSLLRWVFKSAKDYFTNPKYGAQVPSRDVLVAYVNKDQEITEESKKKLVIQLGVLSKLKPSDSKFAYEEITNHVKTKEFMSRMENAATDIVEQSKDVDSVLKDMASYLLAVEQFGDEIEIADLTDGWEERQTQRKSERDDPGNYKKYWTGIKKIDERLPRGIRPGWVFSMAAITGVGKSISCNQVGTANLFRGHNVTHIVTENEIEQIMGRYDARVTGVPYDILQNYDFDGRNGILLEQADKMYEMMRDSFDQHVKVIKMPPNKTTIIDIRTQIDRLEVKYGHKTDFLIIDSPELMNPITKFQEYRLQKAAVYWETKAFALERNIGCFVTSQLKSSSGDVPTAEDMAESYDKARILDIMAAMVRTKKHELEDTADVWFLKLRDAKKDGRKITLNTDFSRMLMET